MIELKGEHTDCKIFTDNVEQLAISQVYDFLDHEAFNGCKVRFMPDIHAGAGCVIGTTVELSDKVIPNVIGVDIGCGMLSYNVGKIDIDFKKLDNFIRVNIPSGFQVRSKSVFSFDIEDRVIETCERIGIKSDRALKSIGTLGGGNHFIEIGEDESGDKWITIHSGSRNFGLQIAKYYQKLAEERIRKPAVDVSNVPAKERQKYIESVKPESVKKGMEYLVKKDADNYARDMKLAQEYASFSREIMMDDIIKFLNVLPKEEIESVHNYIDFNDNIIRKGAISAHSGQLVVIPWNMRDGLIIGIGKGNEDWNFSAPHGAGRVMSRSKAKKEVNLEDFEKSMDGIFSSSITESTIDESPFAYKDHSEIEKYLSETVDIKHRVKPLYNFKAV